MLYSRPPVQKVAVRKSVVVTSLAVANIALVIDILLTNVCAGVHRLGQLGLFLESLYFFLGNKGASTNPHSEDFVISNPPPDGGFTFPQESGCFLRAVGIRYGIYLDSYPCHSPTPC